MAGASDRQRYLPRIALRHPAADAYAKFPPQQTVYGWFAAVRDAGIWQSVNHHLVILNRDRTGREAVPSAAVLDSQSVKTIRAVGPRGYDAGKKVLGRKRHALVDTDGRALELQVGAVSVQDCDGAVPLLNASRRRFPFVETCLCGHGLRRRTGARRDMRRDRDRQENPRADRLRSASAPLGRRAVLRVVGAEPPLRQDFVATIA